MSQAVLLAPEEDALGLAEELVDARGIHRDILTETVESGRNGDIMESGRTVCGSMANVKSPLARFSKKVTLAACPWNMSGGLHSHVTEGELKRPHNSLPDIATVMYGQMDVTGVVGTDEVEVVMRADDYESARERFNRILGITGSDPERVVNAILGGEVDPDIAHNEVRGELGTLFMRVSTGYADLRKDVASLFPREDPVEFGQYDAHEAALYSHLSDISRPLSTRQKIDGCVQALEEVDAPGDRNILDLAVGAAVGTIVGNIVEGALFG